MIKDMDTPLATQLEPTKKQKIKRLQPKQRLTIEYWLDPASETFGNLYKSCLKAGFARTYALNVSNLNPNWLSETIEQVELKPEHIKQGITRIATGDINSKSVDDTRLKAYELLGRYAGIDNKGTTTNITLVQPILGRRSIKPTERNVVDIPEAQTS